MPFVRHYLMIARPEEIDTLRRALEALAAKIAPLEGCDGTELYQDADKPERFVFLERWQSSEHQKEGGKDRKSVGEGKRVAGSVDPGGRRIIKKKNKKKNK